MCDVTSVEMRPRLRRLTRIQIREDANGRTAEPMSGKTLFTLTGVFVRRVSKCLEVGDTAPGWNRLDGHPIEPRKRHFTSQQVKVYLGGKGFYWKRRLHFPRVFYVVAQSRAILQQAVAESTNLT